MKKNLMLFPLLALGLVSCGTAQQMINLIDASTESIHCNRSWVEESTVVIEENARVVQGSTEAVKENGRHLNSLQQ